MTPYIKIFTSLVFGLLILSFSWNDWEHVESKNGIHVYKKIDKKGHSWSKLECEIKASPQEIFDFTGIVETLNSWVYGCESTKLLTKDKNTTIYHIVTDMPYPMTDRDAVIKKEVTFHDSGKISSHSMSCDNYPENSKYVRIPEFEAIWIFQPIEHNKTKVIYEVYANPGGTIPDWVLNRFSTVAPFKTMENLKNRW